MKSIFITFFCAALLSSCVAVRFPSEIKVHVELPENISEEQVDRLIDKISPTLGQRKVKTRIEISGQEETTVKEEKTEEGFTKKN